MNISSALNYSMDNYRNSIAKSPKSYFESKNIKTNAIQDTVSLSGQSARKTHTIQAMTITIPHFNTKENAFALGGLRFTSRAWQGVQTAEEAATGYKYYTAPGRVTGETDQNLAAERVSLGKQIEEALRKNGIELGKGDNLRMSVDKTGVIKIDPAGLSEKNKNQVEKIEQALKSVSGLAKNLYLNSAANVMNKVEAAIEADSTGRSATSTAEMGNNKPLYAAAQRESLDEWLRSTLGFGIEDLEAEGFPDAQPDDRYYGQLFDYRHNELSFDDGNDLEYTIYNIIQNSKKSDAIEFEAKFTYQNGTLFDARTLKGSEKSDECPVDQLKLSLQSHNATISFAEDGTIHISGDDEKQIATLLEKAKLDGTYDELIKEIKTLSVDGKADFYAIALNQDGSARLVPTKSTTTNTQDAEHSQDTEVQNTNEEWKIMLEKLTKGHSKDYFHDLLLPRINIRA